MSDYGDQWRSRREHQRKMFSGNCKCGRKFLTSWQTCICGELNENYQPRGKKK